MGLFNAQNKEKQPANPNFMLSIRVLAVGYLGYCLWQIIQLYRAGGADAPSVPLLIGAILVLGGGAVWIAVASFLQWKRDQAEQTAALDAQDAADKEAEEACSEEQ